MKFAIILLLGVLEKCVAPGCSSIKTPAYCLGPGFDNGLSLNLPKYIKASSLEDDDALNAATTPDMMCFWCVTEINKQNKPISGVCNMCTGLVTGQIATNGESKCLKVYTRSRFNPKDVRFLLSKPRKSFLSKLEIDYLYIFKHTPKYSIVRHTKKILELLNLRKSHHRAPIFLTFLMKFNIFQVRINSS
jgi:hypothetical protein